MEFEDLLNLTVTPKAVASIVGQHLKPTPCAQQITTKLGAASADFYWSAAVFNTLKSFNAEQPGERGGRGEDMSGFGTKNQKSLRVLCLPLLPCALS